jgi:hypothetical protein
MGGFLLRAAIVGDREIIWAFLSAAFKEMFA